jgi:hypothetical protein
MKKPMKFEGSAMDKKLDAKGQKMMDKMAAKKNPPKKPRKK